MILWVDRTLDLVRRSLRVESRFFLRRGQGPNKGRKKTMQYIEWDCVRGYVGVVGGLWGCSLVVNLI
jgi:hypothetical protein